MGSSGLGLGGLGSGVSGLGCLSTPELKHSNPSIQPHNFRDARDPFEVLSKCM